MNHLGGGGGVSCNKHYYGFQASAFDMWYYQLYRRVNFCLYSRLWYHVNLSVNTNISEKNNADVFNTVTSPWSAISVHVLFSKKRLSLASQYPSALAYKWAILYPHIFSAPLTWYGPYSFSSSSAVDLLCNPLVYLRLKHVFVSEHYWRQ
jgi:hypothetical protein